MTTRYKNWIKNAETPDEKDFFILPFDQKKKHKMALVNLCFCFLFIALQIAAGLVNQASSRTAWIFYPYIVLFLPVAYFAFGAVTFVGLSAASAEVDAANADDASDVPQKNGADGSYFQGGLSLSRKEWEKSLARCKHSGVTLLVLSALNVLLELVYIFTHMRTAPEAGNISREVLYLAVLVCLVLVSVGYGIFFDRSFSKPGESAS